jgi:hypothetical protein
MALAGMSMLAKDGLDTAALQAVADRVMVAWPRNPDS